MVFVLWVVLHPAQAQTSCSFEGKPSFTQGQPVVMQLGLGNRTFAPAVFDLGYDREGAFLFKLKLPDGSSIELPQKQIREGIALVGKLTVPPQENYSQQIILDDWYKFKDVGTYSISLTIPHNCGPMELPIKITPFDADALNSVCSQLLEKIRQNKHDYAKAADAANVLARVHDPLVVPFLKQALEANSMVDSILVPALAKFSTK
jgi:hypothetical protein